MYNLRAFLVYLLWLCTFTAGCASSAAAAAAPPSASATGTAEATTAAIAQPSVPGTPTATVQPQDNQDEKGPPSLFEDPSLQFGRQASILVRLSTFRNVDALDNYTLYPYPIKPPVVKQTQPLPTSPKEIRQLILTTGYQARPNLDKAYQAGGWRWIFAYKAALKKSGLSEPHTIASEYVFANDMMPYITDEVTLRNQFEEQREARYLKAAENWESKHVEGENEAIRLGLMPIALRRKAWSLGGGNCPSGHWWLQATRKVPGMTYYWLQEITVAPGQHLEVDLNDNNAMAIVGGW